MAKSFAKWIDIEKIKNVQGAIRNLNIFFNPLDFFSPLCYTKIFNRKGIKYPLRGKMGKNGVIQRYRLDRQWRKHRQPKDASLQ